MEDASHKDLSQFSRWYSQAGTPILDVMGEYDAEQKKFTLTVKQSCPPTPKQSHKEPFLIPLALGLLDAKGHEMVLQLEGENSSQLKNQVVEIKNPLEKFIFVNITENPTPSLLRNFSAPVKLNYAYKPEQLALLTQSDTDAFVRWDSSQRYAWLIVSELLNNYENNQELKLNELFIKNFTKIFEDKCDDLNFLARMLVLPSENYLLSTMPGKDIEAIHKVRKFIKQQLAMSLEERLLDHYQKNHSTAPYQYTSQDMGKRSIKNICLSYLLEIKNLHYPKLAYDQFKNANNMTDGMGALAALNDHEGIERENAFKEFYERWKHEPLAVNKWFALQASSALPGTLMTVKELTKHPAFNIKNPNDVYSLIRMFAENLVCFHDKSGEGYQFIADMTLDIDPHNPLIASHIVQPLTQWGLVDEQRAALMKKELARIAQQPHLSKDLFEVIAKSAYK